MRTIMLIFITSLIALTLLVSCGLRTPDVNRELPRSYGEYVRTQGLLDVVPGDVPRRNPPAPQSKINFDNKSFTLPTPSQPVVIVPPGSQVNPPSPAPERFGLDSEGNASVLTPDRSGGYLAFDREGTGTIVTPLAPGGHFGIDNQGNTWTIMPKP